MKRRSGSGSTEPGFRYGSCIFTNSGTEAIEGALKTARKYAALKGNGRFEIIAMEDSFHGRSMGALSVTGTAAYREPFEPLIPGVRFARFNDLDSVKANITDKTCAILLEPLQGEGGIHGDAGIYGGNPCAL